MYHLIKYKDESGKIVERIIYGSKKTVDKFIDYTGYKLIMSQIVKEEECYQHLNRLTFENE